MPRAIGYFVCLACENVESNFKLIEKFDYISIVSQTMNAKNRNI